MFHVVNVQCFFFLGWVGRLAECWNMDQLTFSRWEIFKQKGDGVLDMAYDTDSCHASQ